MGITNEQTTAQMCQLFEQARRYFTLQKDYLSLHGVEMLTRLFTAITLTAILILMGFLVILFGCFALAYWLGDLLDSTILGFAIIAGVLLLAALVVWGKRKAWIVLPTTRFMIGLLGSTVVYPTQEGIAVEKEHLRNQLNENEDAIKETANSIFSPVPEARSRWETVSNLFQNGLTIFQGMQFGMSTIQAARRVFNLGGKKRK